jgi:DNA-binding transcriptional ArsR family regulator
VPAGDPVGAVFSALADPTRRQLVETLARQPAATPTGLAADLPITRQAVTKHLRALSDAGLVQASRAGRETRYELTPQALGQATSWLSAVGADWDERLSRLERSLRERRA